MASGGWCTIAQLSLLYNTDEITDLGDDDKDGTADTGVIQQAIDSAADDIWPIVKPALSAANQTALAPGTYTAGTGTGAGRILETMNIDQAIIRLKRRQGEGMMAGADNMNNDTNHVIDKAYDIAFGLISIE